MLAGGSLNVCHRPWGAGCCLRCCAAYPQASQSYLQGKGAGCTAGSAEQYVVLVHCIAQSSTSHRLCTPGRACSCAGKQHGAGCTLGAPTAK